MLNVQWIFDIIVFEPKIVIMSNQPGPNYIEWVVFDGPRVALDGFDH